MRTVFCFFGDLRRPHTGIILTQHGQTELIGLILHRGTGQIINRQQRDILSCLGILACRRPVFVKCGGRYAGDRAAGRIDRVMPFLRDHDVPALCRAAEGGQLIHGRIVHPVRIPVEHIERIRAALGIAGHQHSARDLDLAVAVHIDRIDIGAAVGVLRDRKLGIVGDIMQLTVRIQQDIGLLTNARLVLLLDKRRNAAVRAAGDHAADRHSIGREQRRARRAAAVFKRVKGRELFARGGIDPEHEQIEHLVIGQIDIDKVGVIGREQGLNGIVLERADRHGQHIFTGHLPGELDGTAAVRCVLREADLVDRDTDTCDLAAVEIGAVLLLFINLDTELVRHGRGAEKGDGLIPAVTVQIDELDIVAVGAGHRCGIDRALGKLFVKLGLQRKKLLGGLGRGEQILARPQLTAAEQRKQAK